MAGWPGQTQRRTVWMLGADSPRLSGREDGPRPGLGFPMSAHGESTAYVHHLLSGKVGGADWARTALNPRVLHGALGSRHSGFLGVKGPFNRPILN